MHIEILTEDSSGARLLEHLLPKLIGASSEPHTWRIHSYRGIGRIPAGLSSSSDSSKRILLDQLPRLLRGYAGTPGVDAVVVVLDADDRDCVTFLSELRFLAGACGAAAIALFRLAIEETEAWYFGDRAALLRAYPKPIGHPVSPSSAMASAVAQAFHRRHPGRLDRRVDNRRHFGHNPSKLKT